MKIEFWYIGKTTESFVKQGEELYLKRLKHYAKIKIDSFSRIKGVSASQSDKLKEKETEMLLKRINPKDFIVLLDEGGHEFGSVQMAKWLEKQMNHISSRLIFVVGGAYGFSDKMRSRANFSLSLSKMTFPHELIRVIFLEQLYRAFTILRNEKYHNV